MLSEVKACIKQIFILCPFILKIEHPTYNYTLVQNTFEMPSLCSLYVNIDSQLFCFPSLILYTSIDASNLISLISYCFPIFNL